MGLMNENPHIPRTRLALIGCGQQLVASLRWEFWVTLSETLKGLGVSALGFKGLRRNAFWHSHLASLP